MKAVVVGSGLDKRHPQEGDLGDDSVPPALAGIPRTEENAVLSFTNFVSANVRTYGAGQLGPLQATPLRPTTTCCGLRKKLDDDWATDKCDLVQPYYWHGKGSY